MKRRLAGGFRSIREQARFAGRHRPDAPNPYPEGSEAHHEFRMAQLEAKQEETARHG